MNRGSCYRLFGHGDWLFGLCKFLQPLDNAHLAVSECVLAGVGLLALWQAVGDRLTESLAHRALVIGASVMVAGSVGVVILSSLDRAPSQIALREVLRTRVSDSQCLFTFDPAVSLLAGRLPPTSISRIAVDPYAGNLLTALGRGVRYSSTAAAFADATSQTEI